ncbi:MAG TPA: hypothetical protein IAC20_04065 [Candidatus Faecisoma merdavium]|nr:hypothetical protein [Candidatus Faecisoma merdavium]
MASLISDKDIENLERIKQVLSEVKQILKEIRDIDDNFSLSNVIQADGDTTLVFKCVNVLFKQNDLSIYEEILSDKFNRKCILLNGDITLDKAIGIDYAKGKDYTTTTFYNDQGNIVKEETIQYK